MKFIKDFKEFAVKGNMFDMAIGVIIGGAFGKIVNSIVKDLIMPPLGWLLGKTHFTELGYVIQPEVVDENGNVISEEIMVNYGHFIQVCVDFIIIALTIFVCIKVINRLRSKAEDNKDVTVPTPKDIELLSEIRDLLKTNTQKQ